MITAPRFSQFLAAQIAADGHHRRGPTSLRTPTRVSAVHTRTARSASLYDTLGVPLNATCKEIKAAYRLLARTCHPDVGASADEFMRLHAAYATLSDPGKRAEYDRAILDSALQRQRVQTRPDSDFSGGFPRRRTWETDQCW